MNDYSRSQDRLTDMEFSDQAANRAREKYRQALEEEKEALVVDDLEFIGDLLEDVDSTNHTFRRGIQEQLRRREGHIYLAMFPLLKAKAQKLAEIAKNEPDYDGEDE